MTIQIEGFGLAGACLALALAHRGAKVFVHDDGLGGSTRVAAGLVNPVAGKNFQPSWRINDFWPEALRFYESLDVSLFKPMPIFRKWLSDQAKFEKKEALVRPWVESISAEGVFWRGGGWLDTSRFLEQARQALLALGVRFEQGSCEVKISCTGARGLMKDDAKGLSHRCAKGEMLKVRITDWQQENILTGGGWLIPIGQHEYRVGATYDWDGFERGPTSEGREKVVAILEGFTRKPFEIVDHVSGVRPIVRRSQPVLFQRKPKEWIFNGLGSKGVIYAPGTARRLADHLLEGKLLDSELEWTG